MLPPSSRAQVGESVAYIWKGSIFSTFEGKVFLQNIGNHSPNNAMSHPRRLDFSITLLWKYQNSHISFANKTTNAQRISVQRHEVSRGFTG